MIDNKLDKRTLIMVTTLDLISEQGFHGTPISMIAQRAGIGAGTIYRYFANKEELINELFKEIKREVIRAKRVHMNSGLCTYGKIWCITLWSIQRDFSS
jgi:AcrR family transcriptional regulator